MTIYTTKQGDMWDRIAFEAYGYAKLMDRVIDANLDYIDYYVFPAGVVLTIPDVDLASADNLPPWKIGSG